MHVTDIQMKMIALGLIPVFIVLAVLMPKTPAAIVLSGIVMFAGFVACYLGMSMQKEETEDQEDREDLLAVPPKRS